MKAIVCDSLPLAIIAVVGNYMVHFTGWTGGFGGTVNYIADDEDEEVRVCVCVCVLVLLIEQAPSKLYINLIVVHMVLVLSIFDTPN